MAEANENDGGLIKVLAYVAGAFGLSYLFYKIYFLRRPARNIPNSNKVFVSPANGHVISVRPFNSDSIIETKDEPADERGAIKILASDVASSGTIVSIRLQLTDVHYQRAPISGQVLSVDYTQGSFKNAIVVPTEDGTRYENEHNAILLQSEAGLKYKVVQIAGILARGIECIVKPSQMVNQGEILGRIIIGSQVSVVFPSSVKIAVKVGDAVIDGETVIGTIN